MGRERKGASSAPQLRRVKNWPAWGAWPGSGQSTRSRRMSAAGALWLRTVALQQAARMGNGLLHVHALVVGRLVKGHAGLLFVGQQDAAADRKSTRLNSSHVSISYAVFCLENIAAQ